MNKLIKNTVSQKAKKVMLKAIMPFLPFLIIIIVLVFAICTIIDAVFVQEVQSDASSMSEIEQKVRNECIEKASYLNTCHNYINEEVTQSLLDIDNREIDKQIEWSHLYAIMAFHNMTNGEEISEDLLNKVASQFESTFRYEQITIKTEITITDEEGNETTSTSETPAYILVESDTIMGHYKYNCEEKTIQSGNVKTTTKEFIGEELIGERYERLRNYLKDVLHIKENDLETDIQIVIQAAYRLL